MAIHAYRTPSPTVQPQALLRGAVPVTTPDLTAETHAMLDAIEPVTVRHGGAVCSTPGQTLTLARRGGAGCRDIPTTDLFAGSGENPSLRAFALAEFGDLKSEEPSLLPPAPLPSLTAAFSRRRAIFGAVEVEPSAIEASNLALARVRHARRALEGALEHGTALLAVLGLPRLVEPGFVPIDPTVAGDALEAAIAALDALDSPFDDIEDGHDAERDTSDAELDLGWSALHSQIHLGNNTDDGDLTSPERFGRGFVRCKPDDHEPSLGAPEVYFGRHLQFLGDQTYWNGGRCKDLELGDDNGVADNDGLQEQFAGSGRIPTLAWTVGGYVG